MVDGNNPQEQIRPTKKQQELLGFIHEFIVSHGYGPSYREIMAGCNYTSVATVALHVNNLVKRGHLIKRDRSARSLEVVNAPQTIEQIQTNAIKPAEEKWLTDKVDYRFKQLEAATEQDQGKIDELHVLVEAMKVLGLLSASNNFAQRLIKLKQKNVEVEV